MVKSILKAQYGLTLPNPQEQNTNLVWNQVAYVPKNQRPLTLDEWRKNILWRFNYNNNYTVNNRNNNRPKNIGIFTNPAYGKRTKMVSDGGEVE